MSILMIDLCTAIFLCIFLCLSLVASRDHFLSIDHECCHNTSEVAAHADQVVGFSIFTLFQVSSFDQNVVNLFVGPFRRSVCRLLSKRFSAHRDECRNVLYHQPLLHPISSFVLLFECVRTDTDSFYSIAWAQFGIEFPSHNLYALLSGIRVFLDCLCIFSM